MPSNSPEVITPQETIQDGAPDPEGFELTSDTRLKFEAVIADNPICTLNRNTSDGLFIYRVSFKKHAGFDPKQYIEISNVLFETSREPSEEYVSNLMEKKAYVSGLWMIYVPEHNHFEYIPKIPDGLNANESGLTCTVPFGTSADRITSALDMLHRGLTIRDSIILDPAVKIRMLGEYIRDHIGDPDFVQTANTLFNLQIVPEDSGAASHR